MIAPWLVSIVGAVAGAYFGLRWRSALSQSRQIRADLLDLAADGLGEDAQSLSSDAPGFPAALVERIMERARAQDLERRAELFSLAETLEAERQVSKAAAEANFKSVEILAEALEQLALGDLNVRIEERLPLNFDQIRIDFNASMEALGRVMGSILEATEAVSFGASELSRAAQRLAARTDQQAVSVKTSSQSLDSLMKEVNATYENAARVQVAVVQARESADRSTNVMRSSVEAIGMIKGSSRQIGEISGVIGEIAFQTSLLALNAGVEAARAGDAGRGFAVVASEVRALAVRSAQAAKEISALVERADLDVKAGESQITATQAALAAIVQDVVGVHLLVDSINESSRLQHDSITAISKAIVDIDLVTQNNVAMVDEATQASSVLADEARALTASVSRFRTGGGEEEAVIQADDANAEIDRLFA